MFKAFMTKMVYFKGGAEYLSQTSLGQKRSFVAFPVVGKQQIVRRKI